MIRVSIIIVNWNSGSTLLHTVRSILSRPEREAYEVILVDNHSQDGSVDLVAAHFPDLQIITHDTNLGFAAANNAGIRIARGQTLLLLNPDAAVRGEAIDRLYQFLEQHPEAGAVGGKLLNRDGTPQVGFNVRTFPTLLTAACELLLINALWPGNPVNRRYRCLDWDYQTAREADQPAGACLMVRRSVIERVGGLDEQFFPAWFEDVDWCRRIKAAGWKIYFTPEAEFYHLGGLSMQNIGYRRFLEIFHRNMTRYFRKHHGRFAALGIKILIFIGMLERIILTPFRTAPNAPRRSTAVQAYLAVLAKSFSF